MGKSGTSNSSPLPVPLGNLLVLAFLLKLLPLEVFDPLLELHLCHFPGLLLAELLLQLLGLQLLQPQSLLPGAVLDLESKNLVQTHELSLHFGAAVVAQG